MCSLPDVLVSNVISRVGLRQDPEAMARIVPGSEAMEADLTVRQ